MVLFKFFLISMFIVPPSLAHSHIHSSSLFNNHINPVEDSLFENNFSKTNSQNQNQGGVSTCLPNYEISEGSIIRTKDSMDVGGKFLNTTDVGVNGGKEECMRLCCRTPYCNVVVFQEKSPGSCYMFDCGSTEDFRCKFTSQIQYTSAILKFKKKEIIPVASAPQLSSNKNNANTGVGQNIGGASNQHETELSQLRTRTEGNQPPNLPVIIGRNDANAAAILFPTTSASPLDGINSPRCSRWQFECKSSRECIAIYNACDGILQCDDGSDEGPELHCPSVNPVLGIASHGTHNVQQASLPLDSKGSGAGQNRNGFQDGQNLGQVNQNSNPLISGKENDHIFNHKNGGVMDVNYGSQLQLQNKQLNPFFKGFDYNAGEQLPNMAQYAGHAFSNSPNNPYGNANANGDGSSGLNYGGQYPNYNQNNPLSLPQFKGQSNSNSDFQQYQVPPILQQANRFTGNKAQQNPMFIPPVFPNPNNNVANPSVIKQGNNDNSQQRLQQQIPPLATTPPVPKLDEKPKTTPGSKQESKVESGVKESPKNKELESEEKVEQEILKSIKSQPYNNDAESAHLDSGELSSKTAGPGAVFLFIVGLGMTIVMAVIVGCRLRRVGVGARRRRKNRLDPDYLVDGMYL